MELTQLVADLASWDESASLSPFFGFFGIQDPTDITNGDYTSRYGKIPLDDPQFQDVLKFVRERVPTDIQFFTPVSSGWDDKPEYRSTYVVFRNEAKRAYIADAADVARAPHIEMFAIIAFCGRVPDPAKDRYPGLVERQKQSQGHPVDLSRPWPEMGVNCYHPSAADSAQRFPADQGFEKSIYRDEHQRVFQVFNRITGVWWFGQPVPPTTRVWQQINK